MRRRTPCLSLALLLLLLALSPAACSNRDTPVAPGSSGGRALNGGAHLGEGLRGEIVPNQGVVVLADERSLDDFLTRHGLRSVATLTIDNTTYHLVETKDGSDFGTRAFGDPLVTSATEHNRIWMPEGDRGGLPFDDHDSWRTVAQYETQPLLARIRLPEAVEGSNLERETIAILDTGIDVEHPLFVNTTIQAMDDYTVFPPQGAVADVGNGKDDDGDGVADEGVGHGTHVAGILATGAPKAHFYIFKVLDDEGWGTAFGLASAAKDAVSKGADVINMSLGLTSDDPMIRHLSSWIAEQGIALVASAGNRNSADPQYPGAYEGAFGVAAVDGQDVRAPFSNYGTHVDISAPGVDIISAIPKTFGSNRYAIASGTSMATPFVTAAVAVVHSYYPEMRPRDIAVHVVAKAIGINAMNPGYEGLLGGRVDFMAPIESSPAEIKP